MPLAGVQDAAKDYHAKKAAAESGGTLYFNLKDGEEATVRPLEDGSDFTSYYVHRLPQVGNRFPQIPCLDQKPRPTGQIPCPGCEDGHKRSYRFAVNVIHRNAPVPERDENNRIRKDANNKPVWKTNPDGTAVTEDQVKVWNGGIELAETLDHLDGKYGGLTGLDFDVSRRGTRLDTTYTVLPAGEKRPLSDRDKKLAAAKFDLNQMKQPPEYDVFYAYQGANSAAGGGGGGQAPSVEQQATSESPFKRRNRAG
jgi:hypothetical protein